MRGLVIYHAGCYDGFGAAWAAWKHPDWRDAEFLAAHYQTDPPDVTGRRVLVVDFSYPREVMEKMHRQAEYLRVYDHHKTAEEALAGLPFAVFDMDRSGARITWDALHAEVMERKGDIAPELIRYIEDRDLWRFSLPGSREFTAALRSHPFNFELWDTLDATILRSEGRPILRYQRRLVEQAVGAAYETEIGLHRVWTVNSTVMFSEIAHELIRNRSFGTCWFQRKDGLIVLSLRSRGDFDVSAVAKCFGGGGHKNSAGCQLISPPR